MPERTYSRGPYTIGGSFPVVIEGVEESPARVWRDNDGALAIMAPDREENLAEGDYARRRIGSVNPTFHPKRGTGHAMAPEDDPEQWATALLLLAAPDLLDALEQMVEAYHDDGCTAEQQPSMVRAALAAIAKACGE